MARETTQKSNATDRQTSATSRGGSGGSAAAVAGERGDRERGIATGREGSSRESSGKEMARSGRTSPAQGATGQPLLLMQRMAQDMDRLFEQFGFARSGFSLMPSLGAMLADDLSMGRPALVGTDQTLWAPPIELFQRGDTLVVRADLPGVKKEDLSIEVQNDLLTLSGERREEHEEEREGFYRSERSYGRFSRTIPLPEGVDADQVNATFADGVLELTFAAPKQEERNVKRIPVR
jgi:HSP20 family protein